MKHATRHNLHGHLHSQHNRDAPVVDGDVRVVHAVNFHVVETSEVAVVSQRSLRRLHLLVRLAALTAQPRAT